MKSKATFQMVAIAERIAANYGVSVDEVLVGWRRGVKKTAYTTRDFFWGDSDISLRHKKMNRRSSAARLPRACGVASRKLGV